MSARHRWLRVLAVVGVVLASTAVFGAAVPAWAAGLRWSAARDRAAGNLIEVACPSMSLCVGVNSNGGIAVSSAPADGARSWRVVPGVRVLQLGGTLQQQIDAAQVDTAAYDLSCPSVHLCVVGSPGAESAGASPGFPPIARIFSTTDPTGGASAWHAVSGIDADAGQIASLTCPLTTRCYALENVSDQFGNVTAIVLSATHPAGPASAWTWTGAVIDNYTEGVACASPSLCVAGSGGGMYGTTDAIGPSSTWRFATDTDQQGQMDAVTCSSVHFCIAQPDEAGCIPCGATNDLISTDPGAGIWSVSGVATGALACPTADFCIGIAAGTRHGNDQLAYSGDPAGPPSAWHYVKRIAGNPQLRGIACRTASLCVAVGDNGWIAVGKPVS